MVQKQGQEHEFQKDGRVSAKIKAQWTMNNEREIKIQAFYLVDYKTVHYANIRDSPERSQENIL